MGIRVLKLSVDELGARVRQGGKLAGVDRRVTPHSLWYRCFTRFLGRGLDLRVLSHLPGHASSERIQLCIQVSQLQMLAAMEKLETFLKGGGREAPG